jgi:hypothetical protein
MMVWQLAADEDAIGFVVPVDAPCRVEVDGRAVGAWDGAGQVEIRLAAGEHDFVAIPAGSEISPWRKKVRVSAIQTVLEVPLKAHLAGLEIERLGYWKDAESGLAWAPADNGSGVTASQARSFCSKLTVRSGPSGWRLPSIFELQKLFGGPQEDRGFRVRVPLRLTGWDWSVAEGHEPGALRGARRPEQAMNYRKKRIPNCTIREKLAWLLITPNAELVYVVLGP